ELELALTLAVGRVLAALDDRQVGVEEAVANRAQVGEVLLHVGVQVVEEQPAHAAGLVAVPEVEVLVAPALVGLVALLPAERLAQRARGAVPVQHVLVEGIERGQVEAAAEPPGHGSAVAQGAEVAHVGVGGGQVGIARVEHQRHAHRLPGRAGQLRARGRGRRRQPVAGHVGEADPGLLEHRALAQYPGAAAAAQVAAGVARIALPGVLGEAGAAVGDLDRGADAVLQAGEVVADVVESVHADILGVARAAGIASGQARPPTARAPPPWTRSQAAPWTAGLLRKCPPESASGGFLLLEFAAKARRGQASRAGRNHPELFGQDRLRPEHGPASGTSARLPGNRPDTYLRVRSNSSRIRRYWSYQESDCWYAWRSSG